MIGQRGDVLHPWALAEAYAEALPNAKLVGFAEGHAATETEMADLLVEFLAGL